MARSPTHRRGRLIRIVALALGGLVVFAVVAVVVVVATFDPNSYKPQIVAAVRSATGRELKIGGRIGLSISLQPTLEVSDVSFSNPPGFSRPQMAMLHKLELQLALVPLLSRQIQIVQLVLGQPDILLETDAKGQPNWQFAPAGPAPAPVAPAGNAAPATPLAIALSNVRIEGGTLALRNAAGQTTTLALSRLTATAASPDAPLHLTVDATYNGTPVGLTADTGPLSALTGGGGSWPVKLALTAAGARLGVEGTVAQPATGRELALALTADIPDLAALSSLAGTPLPPLKTIAAQLKLADTDGGNTIAVSDLKLSLPKADLAGSASFRRGTRPMITANLTGKQIDLDSLKTSLPAGAPAKPAAPAARTGHVIPDTKLPLDALRHTDIDVQLAVDDLLTGGQDYKAAKLHLVAKDGKLTLDPAGVATPSGQVDAALTMDANLAAPPVTLTLRAPALALQALLKAIGKPGYATGTLELRADMKGAGDSPHAIAASLDGAIGAALAKGEIDSQMFGGLMSSLLKNTEISQLASKAGMSALNCFALRLDVSHGAGTLRALKLDSSTLGLDGTGGMNFGTETLDMHLKPTVDVAGTNVAAPVVVTGTFADPSIQPDAVGLVTGNAGTVAKLALGASTGGLGLIAGSAIEKKLSGDPCAAPLALARLTTPPAAGSQPGGTAPAASQPQGKPSSGPASAIKSLFH